MKKVSILIPYVRPDLLSRAVSFSKLNAGIPSSEFNIITVQDSEKIGHTKLLKQMVDNSESEMVAFIHDDNIPHANYLKNALETMREFKDGFGLVGFNDGLIRPFSTHWLAHRKLLPLLDGEFLHTGYKHCCCDVELAERCQAMGRYKVSEKAFVEHDNPIIKGRFDMGVEDETYRRVYSPEYLIHDRKLLQKRRSEGWPKEAK